MWNKEKHQLSMKSSVNKLVSYFQSKGITFTPTDGKLHNVVFTSKDNKQVKLSHHSFYRYSGIASVTKDGKEKNSIEVIEVTDEMYLNTFIKPVIELLFKVQD